VSPRFVRETRIPQRIAHPCPEKNSSTKFHFSGKLIQREDSTSTKVAIRRASDASRTTAKLHSNSNKRTRNPQEERDGDKELTPQCAMLGRERPPPREPAAAEPPIRRRNGAAPARGFGDLARRGLRRGKGGEERR
jgi:hypothetical protein